MCMVVARAKDPEKQAQVRLTLRSPSLTMSFRVVSFQMTVESNYEVPSLIDCLDNSPRFSTNEKQNQNQSHFVRAIFPRALSNSQVLSRSSDWFIMIFAPVVIARSNYFCIALRDVFAVKCGIFYLVSKY